MSRSNQIKRAAASITKELGDPFSWIRDCSLSDKIQEEVSEWSIDTRRKLLMDDPYSDHFPPIEKAEAQLKSQQAPFAAFQTDFSHFHAVPWQSPQGKSTGFYEDELNKLVQAGRSSSKEDEARDLELPKDKLLSLRRHFARYWRKSLEQEQGQWELETIEQERKILLEHFKERLEVLNQIMLLGEQLGFEPGLLWDQSTGNLSLSDLASLQKWAEYMRENKSVRELCDLLGRLRQVQASIKREQVKYTEKLRVSVPDIDSREEIVGIKIGKELEHVLPQELALLADEETSILFDMKYVEGRLLSFEFSGSKDTEFEQEKVQKVEVEEEDKLGPIILCIDTSGSMQGAPENIAKAISLSMTSRAMSQDRSCYLINFSTQIETLELTSNRGLSELISFLQMSFHGGTDPAPALNHGVEKMLEDGYKNADLLMISDFVMGGLAQGTKNKIAEVKKEGSRFYSLCIGDSFLEKDPEAVFNQEWVYNPKSTTIEKLTQIIKSVADVQG